MSAVFTLAREIPAVVRLEVVAGAAHLHLTTGEVLPVWDGDGVSVSVSESPHTVTLFHGPLRRTVILPLALVLPVLEALDFSGETIRAAFPDFESFARAHIASLPVLEDVADMGHALVFMGRLPDGAPCFAEVPRPLRLSMGRYFFADPVPPADLTIWQGPEDAPTSCFLFTVYNETPTGRALLNKLAALT